MIGNMRVWICAAAILTAAGCGGGTANLRLLDAETALASLSAEDGADAAAEELAAADQLLQRSRNALADGKNRESDRLAELALLRVESARANIRAAQLQIETRMLQNALETSAAEADQLRNDRNKTLDALKELNETD